MISYGIVSLDQIPVLPDWSRQRVPVALTLLAEINARYRAEDEYALALIYRLMRGGEHNHMRTFPQRYRALDQVIALVIDRVFAPDRPVRVHEMAASNAITSLELFEQLKHRRNLSFLASDYFDRLHVVSVPGSRWRVVFDAECQPLQFIGRRMVIAADREESAAHPINRSMQRRLTAVLAPIAARVLAEAGPDDGRIEQISLFHPRCLALARSDPRFTLGRVSVFEPEATSYDVIRIMGMVRKAPIERVQRVFTAVAPRLASGGLLIAGFNREPRDLLHVPTTIFQRQGRRFVAIRDFVGGYEYKQVILDIRFDAQTGAASVPAPQ
jgi:hypothetical protein